MRPPTYSTLVTLDAAAESVACGQSACPASLLFAATRTVPPNCSSAAARETFRSIADATEGRLPNRRRTVYSPPTTVMHTTRSEGCRDGAVHGPRERQRMKLESLLPLLRCPRTGDLLTLRGDTLVAAGGETYPIVSGKPVLVRTIREWHISPPPADKVSRNIASFQPHSPAIQPGSAIIHLGSGNVPADDPRVVSCDVLPCEHVDLVCEAEALPFRDGCIDYVESGAVFEHVYDPWRAIAEVKRVLAPGGEFRIDTAFMQGYHGFPSHYYNMTPQAVETALVGACELRQGYVPGLATPLMTVVMAVDRYLGFVSAGVRERLLDTTLGEVLDEMRQDLSFCSPLLADFDDYAQRCLAASYAVVGRKQPEHDAAIAAIDALGPGPAESWRTLVREYYALRLELMQRHHEIGYYRRKAAERGDQAAEIAEPQPLAAALAAVIPTSMFRREAIEDALRQGRLWEEGYRRIRDAWIARYLAAGERADKR